MCSVSLVVCVLMEALHGAIDQRSEHISRILGRVKRVSVTSNGQHAQQHATRSDNSPYGGQDTGIYGINGSGGYRSAKRVSTFLALRQALV